MVFVAAYFQKYPTIQLKFAFFSISPKVLSRFLLEKRLVERKQLFTLFLLHVYEVDACTRRVLFTTPILFRILNQHIQFLSNNTLFILYFQAIFKVLFLVCPI